MTVLGIARIMLFAPDVAATAAFYHRVFGLPLLGPADDPEFVELDAGTCRLAIHRGTPSTGRGAPKIVFRSNDVPGHRSQLIRGGAKLGKIYDAPGFEFCDGKDPAGNIFQISSRP